MIAMIYLKFEGLKMKKTKVNEAFEICRFKK